MDWLFVKNRRSKVTTGMVEDHMPAKFSASPTTLIYGATGFLSGGGWGLVVPALAVHARQIPTFVTAPSLD
jgi:hypothetical protein